MDKEKLKSLRKRVLAVGAVNVFDPARIKYHTMLQKLDGRMTIRDEEFARIEKVVAKFEKKAGGK